MPPTIQDRAKYRHLIATVAAVLLMLPSVQPGLGAQQNRVIPLALENVTLECEDDGTLRRIESRAIEPVMARSAEAETEAMRRAHQRIIGQLSRFLANEKAASQALQHALQRLEPPLGLEAAKRLSTALATIARGYDPRLVSAASMRGTTARDGNTVSLTGTLTFDNGLQPVPGPSGGRPPGGVLGSILGGLPGAPPPPPPPPNAPLKVGDDVTPPAKTKHVPAVYPAIAQSARVSGAVVLEITIGADGKVRGAKVTKSIPLLDQAALDAVKGWEFTPTLLNGVPVPVIMSVTVNFALK